MATVPLSGTDIILLENVPFSNDYNNTRWFSGVDAQFNYFQSKHLLTIGEANFQRIEGKHYIAVNKSIDDLWGANYLMFRNNTLSNYGNKWFYAFVTKLEYVQKNTTYVYFEIDVLQTWMFQMVFHPSFVVREHCKLWNEDGTPVINTVDEGLNYGTDYQIKSQTNYVPFGSIYFLVIVAKQGMHSSSGVSHVGKPVPIVNPIPQPLTYYVHPFKANDDAVIIDNVGDVTVWSLASVIDTLKALFTFDDAVNNIVSLYVTEYAPNVTYNGDGSLSFDDSYETAIIADAELGEVHTICLTNVETYNPLTYTPFSDKYSGYDVVTESKLLMYPYTCLIMDDFKGNRVTLKNEYINGKPVVLNVKGSLGTSNKIAYNVDNYLGQSGVTELENAVINNSPNDMPILSDYLSAYLQGNRNTIENQKQAIVFNGVTNMAGSFVGGLASALTGNVIGSASAGIGIAKGGGNAVLQLQGIEAKIKDIDNVPPTLIKLGGNTAFDYGNGLRGIYLIKKQITPEYQKKLSDFFKLYGYKINEVKVPNFHTRQNWNYVQTLSCNITGNFNNDDLKELKQIFDGGITLWHTDDVGNYSLMNGVI